MTNRFAAALLVVVFIAAACSGGATALPGYPDEAARVAIYADLAERLCSAARCGPSHPAFFVLESDTSESRAGLRTGQPDARFVESADALVGADDRVIDGGRILRVGPLQLGPVDGIVLVDTFWESSRLDGTGETYVYQWDGDAWVNVEPSTVGITVTTAVP